MDLNEYRRQFEEDLAQADQPETNFRDLMNRSRSEAKRSSSPRVEDSLEVADGDDSLSAALEVGVAATGGEGQDDLNDALAALRDETTDPELRASALRVISMNIDQRPHMVDALIELLGDPTVSSDVRLAVLTTLQELSFRMVQFPAKRPSYLATLRSMIEDPNMTLRRRVIGILARERDEFVQRRLLEDLERGTKPLVPAAKAIQFLGYDVHAEYFPVLRRIVEHPPSAAAKREAVRLLAADPSSVDLLLSLLEDKTENPEVRRVSAVALQALAPEKFEEQARRIVLDEAEDDELRALSITALAYFGTSGPASEDDELTRRVEQLRSESPSRHVKQATRAYMEQRGR